MTGGSLWLFTHITLRLFFAGKWTSNHWCTNYIKLLFFAGRWTCSTPNGSKWFVWMLLAFQIMIDCEAPTPSNDATVKTKRPRIYPLDPSMVGGGVLYSRHVSPRFISDAGCKQEMVDAPIDGAGSVVQSLQIRRIWNYFGLFILFLLEESKIIQVWDNYV